MNLQYLLHHNVHAEYQSIAEEGVTLREAFPEEVELSFEDGVR